jgi:hypothetical protein
MSDKLTPEDIAILQAITEDMWAKAEQVVASRKPKFGFRPTRVTAFPNRHRHAG